MQAILDWLTEQGVRRVALHARDHGRLLYGSLGFAPTTNEMQLKAP